MNGLNGDVLLKTGDIFVGYVADASEYGYGGRKLRVTVEVRMEELTRSDEYETTDHRKVSKPHDFAITSSVWKPKGDDIVSGGAGVDVLRHLVQLAPGITRDDIRELIRISANHLNSMTAACVHQDTTVPDDVPQYKRSTWLLDHVQACPETGYRYGSKWLVQELPEDVTPEHVRALLHIS